MTARNTFRFAFAISAFLLCGAVAPGAGTDHTGAEKLLLAGRADEAEGMLKTWLAAHPTDGEAHLLLCRVYYSVQLPDPAITECEAALTTLGNRSKAQDWAGRVYGLKADKSGPLTGYSMAKKVKAAFEKAVELDPKDADSVDDLAEFYNDAPSIVGGGTDRTFALATRVEATLPQSARRMRAGAAEKRSDYGTAERQYMEEVNGSGKADTWSDLAGFYVRRKDADKAVDAVKHCLAADKDRDNTEVYAAGLLNELHREPALAEHALRDYLESPNKSDSAPAFKVRTMLGKMLLARGDKTGAKIEFEKALELARDYAPAKKALRTL